MHLEHHSCSQRLTKAIKDDVGIFSRGSEALRHHLLQGVYPPGGIRDVLSPNPSSELQISESRTH